MYHAYPFSTLFAIVLVLSIMGCGSEPPPSKPHALEPVLSTTEAHLMHVNVETLSSEIASTRALVDRISNDALRVHLERRLLTLSEQSQRIERLLERATDEMEPDEASALKASLQVETFRLGHDLIKLTDEAKAVSSYCDIGRQVAIVSRRLERERDDAFLAVGRLDLEELQNQELKARDLIGFLSGARTIEDRIRYRRELDALLNDFQSINRAAFIHTRRSYEAWAGTRHDLLGRAVARFSDFATGLSNLQIDGLLLASSEREQALLTQIAETARSVHAMHSLTDSMKRTEDTLAWDHFQDSIEARHAEAMVRLRQLNIEAELVEAFRLVTVTRIVEHLDRLIAALEALSQSVPSEVFPISELKRERDALLGEVYPLIADLVRLEFGSDTWFEKRAELDTACTAHAMVLSARLNELPDFESFEPSIGDLLKELQATILTLSRQEILDADI